MAGLLSQRDQAPVQLKLAGGWAARAGDLLIGVGSVVAARFFGAFFLGLAVVPQVHGTMTAQIVARTLCVAFAGGCFALGRFGRSSARDGLGLDARLVVTPDALVLHHTGMLAERVVIRREDIRAVAIDGRSRGRKFPVEAERPGRRPIAWLWQRQAWRLSIPSLAGNRSAPNLALLFTEPVSFPGRHRRGGLRDWCGPNGREPAVAVRVSDLDAARRAFERWGLVRALNGEDLALCLPSRGSHRTRP
jgi:hypothetical protein